MNCILLSSVYENNKTVLKFYEPESNKIILWVDNTGHKPHCYTTVDNESILRNARGVESMERKTIHDVINDVDKEMLWVDTSDPLVIGGKDSLRERFDTWESDIKYHHTYLYDKNYVVGKWYDVTKNDIKESEEELTKFDLSKISMESIIDEEEFKKQLDGWTSLLGQSIPKLRRLAVDIEVESFGAMPDPQDAKERVTAISFESEDLHRVLVLNRVEIDRGEYDGELDYEIEFFNSEKELIEAAFRIMETYPVILTYNGDNFDLPYLCNRAMNLRIKDIPLKTMGKNVTTMGSVHIDLYGVFSNRSLKIYAFNNSYVEDSLESVSSAIISEHKIEHEEDLGVLNLHKLAKYCYNDSRLTYKLTSYNNDLVMNLLIILARISNLPIDDISRIKISNWIKSMIYFTHRKRGELIPKIEDFPQVKSSTQAVIEGKKYKGADVFEPTAGVHFGVTVMDFASLYPSIIKTRNISYETVCCVHPECRSNKIPSTEHWACTKRQGIISLLIGSLKELRVNHFKVLSKKAETQEERDVNNTIAQALKVFLNASYGVIGFKNFPLYFLPTAEAITAVGRDIINHTKEEAESYGMEPIYGDTDSIFIKQPTQEQIDKLIDFTREKYAIDLEVDKEYRYLVLSGRKKNYFGVKKEGKIDIKGLTGKKSNTPPFIKKLFNNILEKLKTVHTMEEFESTKDWVRNAIKTTVENFEDIPLQDLTFNVMINKNPKEYTTKPQALKAAEQLYNEPKKGQYIQFIKTWTKPKVKPIELVMKKEIDKKKYMESIEATLEQIVEPMELDMNVLMGRGRATKLEEFW